MDSAARLMMPLFQQLLRLLVDSGALTDMTIQLVPKPEKDTNFAAD